MTFPGCVPTLTDGVVTLRAHREDDVEGLLEQATDPVTVEWTTVPVPSTLDTSRHYATEVIPAGWADGTAWAFAVEAVDGDGRARFAGTVEMRPRGERRGEIAYGAAPWARGRGVMERACRLLLDWSFTERRLLTVVWWANRGNWASRRLAWRLGFSFDGTLSRWLPQRGALLDAWVGTLGVADAREPRSAWLDVPRIVGEQVVLRPLGEADLTRIEQACSDPTTQHWLRRMPQPYGRAEARAYVESSHEAAAAGAAVRWAVADPATDRLLANVALFDLDPGHQAELGYWSHPDHRGRGVTTEACRLAVRHAFVPVEDGGLGLDRVYALAAEGNAASLRVLERAGLTATGRERDGCRLRDGSVQDFVLHDVLPRDLAAR